MTYQTGLHTVNKCWPAYVWSKSTSKNFTQSSYIWLRLQGQLHRLSRGLWQWAQIKGTVDSELNASIEGLFNVGISGAIFEHEPVSYLVAHYDRLPPNIRISSRLFCCAKCCHRPTLGHPTQQCWRLDRDHSVARERIFIGGVYVTMFLNENSPIH